MQQAMAQAIDPLTLGGAAPYPRSSLYDAVPSAGERPRAWLCGWGARGRGLELRQGAGWLLALNAGCLATTTAPSRPPQAGRAPWAGLPVPTGQTETWHPPPPPTAWPRWVAQRKPAVCLCQCSADKPMLTPATTRSALCNHSLLRSRWSVRSARRSQRSAPAPRRRSARPPPLPLKVPQMPPWAARAVRRRRRRVPRRKRRRRRLPLRLPLQPQSRRSSSSPQPRLARRPRRPPSSSSHSRVRQHLRSVRQQQAGRAHLLVPLEAPSVQTSWHRH